MSLNSQPNSKPQWATQFKIDDAGWEEIRSQAEKLNVTPLVLAIDLGLLNENKLIQWDRDISGLASLKTVFFNAEPPRELWAGLDYKKCRAAACLPIANWDGIIYWAKLSSQPTGFETENPNAVWVLAPWTGMKKWFALWEADEQKNSPSPAGGEELELSAPVGLKIDDVAPEPKAPPVIPEQIPDEFIAPAGFHEPTNINIDFSTIGIEGGLPPVPEPLTPPGAAASFELPPLPDDAVTQTNAGLGPAIELDMTPPPPPVPVATPAAGPVPSDELNARLKAAPDQEVLAQTLMKAWLSVFDRVMILLFQNNKLMVWWQSGPWKSQTTRGMEIPLDTPSIFKIVADTGRPYHGYVSPGPINDQFFEKTNGGEYPEHVTVVPVLTMDHVVAMIFGGCAKDAGQRLALAKYEENARFFSESLMRIMSPAKKAG